jgi:hypothetical protein
VIDIREKLIIPKWLIEQFFWKLQDKVLMDEERDMIINLLESVYWYKNINRIIERKVRLDVLFPILDKFFSYYRIQEEEQSNKKKK